MGIDKKFENQIISYPFHALIFFRDKKGKRNPCLLTFIKIKKHTKRSLPYPCQIPPSPMNTHTNNPPQTPSPRLLATPQSSTASPTCSVVHHMPMLRDMSKCKPSSLQQHQRCGCGFEEKLSFTSSNNINNNNIPFLCPTHFNNSIPFHSIFHFFQLS